MVLDQSIPKIPKFKINPRKEEPVIYLIDLFAGAGGTSSAANYSSNKIRVIYCINHDPIAIRSHSANHPDCIHAVEDIKTVNLNEIAALVQKLRKENPNCKIAIWASLECTHFSKAKGGQSRDADSRSLAQHMFRYESIIKPDFFWFENVREFLTWGPLRIKEGKGSTELYSELHWDAKKDNYSFVPIKALKATFYNAWVKEFEKRGFAYEYKLLNSADYGGYTIRTRYFGQFSKDSDLVAWPKQTHSKYPEKTGLKPHKAVKDVLDLKDHGKSIFDRKKPYADATYERIYAGLKKFVANGDDSFIAKYFSGRPEGKVISLDGPAGTIKCKDGQAIVFTHRYNGGNPDEKVASVDGPIGTITTQNRQAIVQCICLAAYYGTTTISSPDKPCGALTTKDRFSKIDCEFLLDYQGKAAVHPLTKPCPTLMTKDKFAPVSIQYINSAYSSGGTLSDINDPSPTITAVNKHNINTVHFVDNQYGNRKPTSILVPCGALASNPKQNVVSVESWIMDTNFSNVGRSVDEPAGTVTANRKYQYLVNPQYNSKGSSIENPCFTLIARTDKAPPYLLSVESGEKIPVILVYDHDTEIVLKIKYFMAAYGISDIKQRMLKIVEMLQIQGFPADYILHGTQEDQKRGIGNSVEVTVGKAFFRTITMNMRRKLNYNPEWKEQLRA